MAATMDAGQSATMAAAAGICGMVTDAVWAEIESARSVFVEGLAVTDDQLSTLHFLFGKNLERAIRIRDMRGVKRVSAAPSGRSVFQHFLAARFASAVGDCIEVKLSDEDLALLLANI